MKNEITLEDIKKEKMEEYAQEYRFGQREQWIEDNKAELEKDFIDAFVDEFTDFCNEAYNREND